MMMMRMINIASRGPLMAAAAGLRQRALFSTTTKFPPTDLKLVTFNPAATLDHPLSGSTAPNAKTPVIAVLQEWWGVNDEVRGHAQRIANMTGAKVIVPDLYDGKMTLDAAEASHMMSNLDWDKAVDALEGVMEGLQREGRKVGITGFCMGGALTLAVAARCADRGRPLNAAVSFYGTPSKKFDISHLPLHTPVQAHFGSEDKFKGFSDETTARELAATWEKVVNEVGGGRHAHGLHRDEALVIIHEGLPHAFMNTVANKEIQDEDHISEDRKRVVNKIWQRVFAFFIEHLKSV